MGDPINRFRGHASQLQFSGTPATGFLGRLGGQASSPISCCCNDMLSLDCRLEGAPSVPKSCRKWRFSSRIRASVHSLTWRFLGWSSRAIVCCELAFIFRPFILLDVVSRAIAVEPSAFVLHPSSFRLHPCIQAMEPAVCGMVAYRGPSRMARWTCRFSYTTMHHVGGTRARFGRLSTDVSASGRLMVIFLFFQRSRLCVSDVRPWKGSVELKGAELAAATVPPAVAHARGAYGRPDPRVEADSIDFGVSAGSKE